MNRFVCQLKDIEANRDKMAMPEIAFYGKVNTDQFAGFIKLEKYIDRASLLNATDENLMQARERLSAKIKTDLKDVLLKDAGEVVLLTAPYDRLSPKNKKLLLHVKYDYSRYMQNEAKIKNYWKNFDLKQALEETMDQESKWRNAEKSRIPAQVELK
jgi:hypothetical protein